MMTDGSKVITLDDIAKKTGYSICTVSKAMRNSSKVASRTAQNIRNVANNCGYVPNHAARQLSSGRSGIVGIYSFVALDEVWSRVVYGLLQELNDNNHSPVFAVGSEAQSDHKVTVWMDTFKQFKPEIMIFIVQDNINEVLSLWDGVTPCIYIGCYPDQDVKGDCIALDRKAAGVEAVNHLISKGYKKILGLNDCTTHFTKGVMKAMSKAGLKPYCEDISSQLGFGDRSSYMSLARNLAESGRVPDAVIASSTLVAMAFIEGYKEIGIIAGKDFEVLIYDYEPIIDVLQLSVTTIEKPVSDIIENTLRVVHKRLESPKSPKFSQTLNHKFVLRHRA